MHAEESPGNEGRPASEREGAREGTGMEKKITAFFRLSIAGEGWQW